MVERVKKSFIAKDFLAGIVVFLVALPLCLGIALASNAPLISGVLSGIIGGLIVGAISQSKTSVSGPAAGLAAIVVAQIATLGSFEAFLVAVFLAGLIQIGLGIAKGGFISAFFPSSVIKGLLAGIGIILIIKQIPILLGYDPVGPSNLIETESQIAFEQIPASFFGLSIGAMFIGFISLATLIVWDKITFLRKNPIPSALFVVLAGVATNWIFERFFSSWAVGISHLVQLPKTRNLSDIFSLFTFPDWSALLSPQVFVAAFTLAVVASLETLLNVEAIDNIDPKQRHTPMNRELLAQGTGNLVAGLIGGLPLTSVIVRSSVNINSNNETKLSTIFHGFLLLIAILFIPHIMNKIPLSSLAAILLLIGFKLAHPKMIMQMFKEGKRQFLPFAVTTSAIVMIDLLTGILIGLGVSLTYILYSNFRKPLHKFIEQHSSGQVLRIEFANQVSFLNRANLENTFNSILQGGHILLDARKTNYIDPDILDLIQDFKNKKAPARGITLSYLGFKDKYPEMEDRIEFVDYTSQEVQSLLTPERVMELLKKGNERFRTGQRIERDYMRQVTSTSLGQAPMAVILSCIDSRTSAELIFDLGIGDIFSARVAGNIVSQKIMGSIEFSCAVAGAKLIFVLGHTACGAIASSLDLHEAGKTALEATGCEHIDIIVQDIQDSIENRGNKSKETYVNEVARTNVIRSMKLIYEKSAVIRKLVQDKKIEIRGGLYDIQTGNVEFIEAS